VSTGDGGWDRAGVTGDVGSGEATDVGFGTTGKPADPPVTGVGPLAVPAGDTYPGPGWYSGIVGAGEPVASGMVPIVLETATSLSSLSYNSYTMIEKSPFPE